MLGAGLRALVLVPATFWSHLIMPELYYVFSLFCGEIEFLLDEAKADSQLPLSDMECWQSQSQTLYWSGSVESAVKTRWRRQLAELLAPETCPYADAHFRGPRQNSIGEVRGPLWDRSQSRNSGLFSCRWRNCKVKYFNLWKSWNYIRLFALEMCKDS